MNLARLTSLLFLLVGLGAISQAQEESLDDQKIQDTIKAFFFYDSAFVLQNPEKKSIDTDRLTHQYYKSLIKKIPFSASQGNTGQVYTMLVWKEPGLSIDPRNSDVYSAYRLTPHNIPYYLSNVPVTELFYLTGRHKEQIFNGQHYQQVRKNLGIGLKFNITNAPGGYNRQKVDNTSAAVQLFYRTNNYRYGFAANYISNRFSHYENGGISTPQAFEGNTERDRKRILINLIQAENRLRERNIYFHQYYRLSKASVPDTSGAKKNLLASGQIEHIFIYNRSAQAYEDRNPGAKFYTRILVDSLKTFDSLVYHTFSNKLQYRFSPNRNKYTKLSTTLFIAHLYTIYEMRAFDKHFNQINPRITGEMDFGTRSSFSISAETIFGNLNKGDYELTAEGSYRLGSSKPMLIRGYVKKSHVGADLFYSLYSSNHFGWANDFGKQKIFQQKISIELPRLKTELKNTSVEGYIYLDTLGLPAVNNKSFSVLSALFQSDLEWNKVKLENSLVYQLASDNMILHLPALCLSSSLSYELELFKGALQTNSGIALHYNTSWQAPAYMPALRSYYLQTKHHTGNYLFADVFINLRLKRARLFLLLQHANEGLFGYTYYMISGYPMPDRAFKFGVNWIFFD